jgi:glycosyltransferase involved in cell wall biosynthesis
MTTVDRPDVLHVLHVLEALEGGTARHLADVVRWCTDVRHHVAVPSDRVGWVTDHHAVATMADAGATVHIVEMRRRPAHYRNAHALVRLRALIKSTGADIVHAHSSIGGVLGRVAATGLAVRRLYTPNGVATGSAALALERALGRMTDRLVAVSESEAALVVAAGIVPPDRVTVIPNGIDLSPSETGAHPTTDVRAWFAIPPAAPLVGTVARLVPQKAPEILVRVARHVHRVRGDVHFLLVGSGPLRDAVERDVAQAGIGEVFHRIDVLPRVRSVLRQLDAYVSTARFEGGPYSPLEAIDAGVPVVLTDVVGNRDVVEHGVSGLLAPVDDDLAIATALQRVIDDRDLADALTAAARRRLHERFDVRAMGDALGRLYAEVLDRP